MKKFTIFLVFAVFVSATSCMKSMIKMTTSKVAMANKVLLHKNPKVGDYAVLASKQANSRTTLKVIAVSSDSVTVLYKIEGSGTAMDEIEFEAVTDFEGNVKKVDTIDKAKNNERLPGKIAKPGDWEYMEWVKLTEEQIAAAKLPEKVIAKAGTFTYEIEGFKMTVLGMDTYMIYLVNKNVKFLQIAAYSLSNGRVTLISELAEQGNKK